MSLRDVQKARTRQMLMEAAVSICAEEGFAYVSIDRIAQRAGASRATFYLHFPSKLDLVKAVNDELDIQGTLLYESLQRHAVQSSPLEKWIREAIGYWSDNRDAVSTAQQAIMAEPDMSRVMEHRTTAYARVVASLISPSIGDEARRLTTAISLILQLERVSYLWQVAGWGLAEGDVVATLTDTWARLVEPWASLGPTPPPAVQQPAQLASRQA